MSEYSKREKQEWLETYMPLKIEVQNHKWRLEELFNRALIPAQAVGDGSARTPGASDRMGNAAAAYVDHEKIIRADLMKAQAEMDAIEAAIKRIPNPAEREVLRLRYMDGSGYKLMAWKDVAVRMLGDDDEAQIADVRRLHNRALLKIKMPGKKESRP